MLTRIRAYVMTLVALCLAVGLILFVPAGGSAQEKHKLSWSVRAENVKFTLVGRLEIPDMPGHFLSIFELRRTWPDNPPTIEGVKLVEEIVRGFTDFVLGNGRAWGYAFWRLENGDTVFLDWQNASQGIVNPDGSRKGTYLGTYVNTGGTGKVRGIKGLGRYSGLTEANAAGVVTRNEHSVEGEYWIEK